MLGCVWRVCVWGGGGRDSRVKTRAPGPRQVPRSNRSWAHTRWLGSGRAPPPGPRALGLPQPHTRWLRSALPGALSGAPASAISRARAPAVTGGGRGAALPPAPNRPGVAGLSSRRPRASGPSLRLRGARAVAPPAPVWAPGATRCRRPWVSESFQAALPGPRASLCE